MSHTSQRRGLDPARPGQELIVLAMIPSEYKGKDGIESAMSELGLKMLEYHPHNWLSRNFNQIRVPQLGPAQPVVEWLHRQSPEFARNLLMRGVAYLSTVITGIYTDTGNVEDLVNDIKGEWLERNREKGYPISIVLSGLFDDVHKCCQKTGVCEHTYLHTLGSFGRKDALPSQPELELITMCGHGLISRNRVQDLARKIRSRDITPREAAEDIAKPCVCGLVNIKRAEDIFRRMTHL
jgi:hypothetical protein